MTIKLVEYAGERMDTEEIISKNSKSHQSIVLETTSEEVVSSMIEDTQIELEHTTRDNMFYYLEGMLAVFFVSQLVPNYSTEPLLVQLGIRWFFLLLILSSSVYVAVKQKLSLFDIGIRKDNLKRSIIRGTSTFLIIFPGIILVKFYTAELEEPIFSWKKLQGHNSIGLYLYIVSYLFHSFFQEVIARGIGQGSLEKILYPTNSLKPIIITSSLFGIMHLHLSITDAVMVAGLSLFLGYFYFKEKNLIAVTWLHFLIGITATALGLI